MRTRTIGGILLLALFVGMFTSQSVFAQSTQVSSNVILSHLSVQLTYPSEVLPSQSVTVNVKAQAKDSFQLTSLTVQVFLADQSNLRQLTSATIAQSLWMVSGNQVSKDIQATVPINASRTSLIALVSENIQLTSYDYSYSYYPYWYGGYGYANYSHYPFYYTLYPSYSYATTSDDAVTSLSYVRATTPEYSDLLAQYQQLQQRVNQTQAQNQKLQQDLQTAQGAISQKDSTIADLNRQLSSTQSTTTLLGAIAVILAVVAIALASIHFRPAKEKPSEDTKQQDTSTPSQES